MSNVKKVVGIKMVLDEIDHELLLLAKEADEALQDEYKKIEAQSLKASNKVLSAFIANSVSYSDFADVNGYVDFDPGVIKLKISLREYLVHRMH